MKETICSLERLFSTKIKLLGNTHPDVIDIFSRLQHLYSELHKETAKSSYQEVMALMNKTFPDGHPHLTVLKESYDDFLYISDDKDNS